MGKKCSRAGIRLKRFRKNAGLSIRGLAEKLHTHHSNIGFWENSGTLPRSNILIPMGKVLGVSVEELLGKTKPRKKLGERKSL